MSEPQSPPKKTLTVFEYIEGYGILMAASFFLIFLPLALLNWLIGFMLDLRSFLRSGSSRKLTWEQKEEIQKDLRKDLKNDLDILQFDQAQNYRWLEEKNARIDEMHHIAQEQQKIEIAGIKQDIKELTANVKGETEAFTEQQMKEMKKGLAKICEVQTKYHNSLNADYGILKQEVDQLKQFKLNFDKHYKVPGRQVAQDLSKHEFHTMSTDLTQLQSPLESIGKNMDSSSFSAIANKFIKSKSLKIWLPKILKSLRK